MPLTCCASVHLPSYLLFQQAIEDLAARAQQLESSLQQVQRECAEAVTAALAVVGRPNTPRGSPRSSEEGAATANVTAVVKQLVDKLKVRIQTFMFCYST